MARQRMLHPDFFTDPKVVRCSALARLLFQGLWCFADREGRVEADPLALKLRILPADNCDIHKLLEELYAAQLIRLYDAQGRPVIWIPGFSKRQKPHPHEAKSTLPPISEGVEITPAVKCNDMPGHFLTDPSGKTVRPSESESESESVSKSESVAVVVRQHAANLQQPQIKNDWDGVDDFWNWFQSRRRAAGCIKEKPPHPRALSSFWAEALRELGGDPEPLREAVFRFGDDKFWQAKDPPCPFAGFVATWPKYVPRGAVAHDA